MFKKGKDQEVDITSLNHILKTSKKVITIFYIMVIIAVILLITYLAKEWKILKYIGEILAVISPIFIGFLIAWFFEPLVSWLEKKKIPRLLGCILIYVALLGVIIILLYLVIPSLISQMTDFIKVIPTIFKEIQGFLEGIMGKIGAQNYIDLDSVFDEVTKNITNYGIELTQNLPTYIFNAGKSIIDFGINFVLGLMIGFYLLYDFNKIKKMINNNIPKRWKSNYHELAQRINNSLRSYVQGILIIMTLVFITQSIGLTIAGMEAPILFALFCAVTDIIPYFGPYIGAIPAIIVGFTVSPITGICVIISIVVVQLLENNFYQPLIMGHTMKLHPVTIMIGLLLFQHFFGILGMVFATPCIACIKVIIKFVMERIGWKKWFQKETKKEIEIEYI